MKRKSESEEEERGVNRGIDEWDELAKKMKTNARQRAKESNNLGEGMDINYLDTVREIGVASLESDVKFDKAEFESFTARAQR